MDGLMNRCINRWIAILLQHTRDIVSSFVILRVRHETIYQSGTSYQSIYLSVNLSCLAICKLDPPRLEYLQTKLATVYLDKTSLKLHYNFSNRPWSLQQRDDNYSNTFKVAFNYINCCNVHLDRYIYICNVVQYPTVEQMKSYSHAASCTKVAFNYINCCSVHLDIYIYR